MKVGGRDPPGSLSGRVPLGLPLGKTKREKCRVGGKSKPVLPLLFIEKRQGDLLLPYPTLRSFEGRPT